MKHDTLSFYERIVQRAVEHIVAGLDEALDLTVLARSASLSPLHFHRIFRGIVGETPLELHRRLRLERAALKLSTTDDPITRIAFDAGYETHESFTRAFRDAYGNSPSEFRQRARAARTACERPPALELTSRVGLHFGDPQGSLRLSAIIMEPQTMNVEVQSRPELRVATVSHKGAYNKISEAFGKLGAIVGPAGLLQYPEAAMVAIYHDDPETTPVAELRSDAGIVVPDGAKLPDGLGELHIPAGRYARTVHQGPYDRIGDTWARFMGPWLAQSGLRVGHGVAYEHYLNNPMNAKPEDLRTALYIALAE